MGESASPHSAAPTPLSCQESPSSSVSPLAKPQWDAEMPASPSCQLPIPGQGIPSSLWGPCSSFQLCSRNEGRDSLPKPRDSPTALTAPTPPPQPQTFFLCMWGGCGSEGSAVSPAVGRRSGGMATQPACGRRAPRNRPDPARQPATEKRLLRRSCQKGCGGEEEEECRGGPPFQWERPLRSKRTNQ